MRGGAWRLLALAFLTLLSAIGAYQTSLVVDGTRYFWLYDAPMIEMRQARDLVDGGVAHGAGESLCGPPGLLWPLVMAAVHLLPVGDGRAALAVLVINWLLSCAGLFLAERLLRVFHPEPGLGLPLLWLALVPCFDVLFWSVNGFGTPLFTVLFVGTAVRLLAPRDAQPSPALTGLLLGALPLARSDGIHAWAGLALLAVATHTDRKRTARMLGGSLIAPAVYALLCHALGGGTPAAEGPPSVVPLPGGPALGLRYVGRFALSYGVALLLALGGAVATSDRRRWHLLGAALIGAGYVLVWGGRGLPGSPYLAHLVPIVAILAVAAVIDAARTRRGLGALLAAAFAVAVFAQVWRYDPTRLAASEPSGTVAGVLIRRFTAPEATVGVLAGGNVAYFSRRGIVFLPGRGPRAGEIPSPPPDLVVVHLPHDRVLAYAAGPPQRDGLAPLLRSAEFRGSYLPNGLPVLDRTTLYFRADSPERERRARWRIPAVRR